ncbi:MAG: hypothetical protein HYX97_01740 [Chloroflexi bacterium]|nr:hypothetical protein [Chloroflexota bacterium]
MVEAVIAILVFALIGSAVLSGLSTTHTSGAATERQSVAENIARNQMEYIFSLPYQSPPLSYPSIAVPTNYSVAAATQDIVIGDPTIERVVVTVSHENRTLLVLETVRRSP